MKLVIMQPYLFPYIGYFQLLAAADRFVLYDDVQFIKGGWINRNRLLINGQPWLFTVPLDQPSPNRLISDIALQPAALWQPKLLQTITQNYRRASSFENVYDLIQEIFLAESNSISDLVRVSLRVFIRYLGLATELMPSSSVYGNASLRAQERVLDICRRERATNYINAMGGQALYDSETFQRAGITLQFIQPELSPYAQQGKPPGFVAGLSIIDVLMNNSQEEAKNLIQRYSLLTP